MDETTKFVIFKQLPKVKGYLDVLDALIISEIAAAQRELDIEGSVVEIGVFFGRSFFLLRQLNRESKILGIDLFDIPAHDGLNAQREQVLPYGERLDLGVTEEMLLAADSGQLSAQDILDKVGPARIFSIDGGHELHHVENDSSLAASVMVEGGVIIFDDTFNPDWPEVTVGLIDFVKVNPSYAVLCVSDKKTYVCQVEYVAEYQKRICAAKSLRQFQFASRKFLGSELPVLRHPLAKKMTAKLLDKAKLSGVTPYVYGV